VALMDNVYARNAAVGRIDTITALSTDDSWQYYYDELDRLIYAGNSGDATRSETFVYDLAHNMLSRTRMAGAYVYPAGNAARPHTPTSVGGRAFTYDGFSAPPLNGKPLAGTPRQSHVRWPEIAGLVL
jgi:hypothetical protein